MRLWTRYAAALVAYIITAAGAWFALGTQWFYFALIANVLCLAALISGVEQ